MKPHLYKRCSDAIVDYIRTTYRDDNGVDAIVGRDTKGFVFAPHVAVSLHLPFIPIRKANKLVADPEDLICSMYRCRKHKVNFWCETTWQFITYPKCMAIKMAIIE